MSILMLGLFGCALLIPLFVVVYKNGKIYAWGAPILKRGNPVQFWVFVSVMLGLPFLISIVFVAVGLRILTLHV